MDSGRAGLADHAAGASRAESGRGRPLPAIIAAPVFEKPKRVPLAKRWWFWASLGTAAVGVVLAAIFLGPRQPYTGNALPGQESVF